ncbi:MAG: autotransporter-associated beta strand repeat-containing protein [Planctomycetales bacterium]|nr:autotransporter-associated beta strand repeat-containing protein [Planctomycetales bacterium]
MKAPVSKNSLRRRPSRTQLRWEQLEQRLALASHVWTGAVSNLWSDGGNWQGGSPAGDTQAILSFPAATNLVTNNDLVGLTVSAIDFSAGNYTIGGNAITLVPGPLGAPRLHMDAAAKNSSIALEMGRAAGFDLTIDVASGSTLTVNGAIGGGTTTNRVVKAGGGIAILGGANTFADEVLISEGTLNIRNSLALGTTSSGETNQTTLNGGTLELQGGLFVLEALAQGTAGGMLREVSGNSRWVGDVVLSSTDLTTQVDALASLTIDGTIVDNPVSSPRGLVKTGVGTLALTAANKYRGVTQVNNGVLRISNDAALGSAAVGTVVSNFSRLDVQGQITVAEPLTLNQSALLNFGGNNVWQGPVTLTNSAIIDAVGSELTISGNIGGNATVEVNSNASGKVILSGANTLIGAITVSGILNLRHPQALGTSSFSSSVTIRSGSALELETQGLSTFNSVLTMTGSGPDGNGALRNLSGDNTWAGIVTLDRDGSSTLAVNAGQLTISGNVNVPLLDPFDLNATHHLTKLGSAVLTIAGRSTISGRTDIDVNAGRLLVTGTIGNVVLKGTSLGGTGLVSTISGSGVIGPGVGAGRLTVTRSLKNESNNSFYSILATGPMEYDFDLNGTTAGVNYDQLTVSTPPQLGFPEVSTLNVHLNFFPTVGTTFRIIDNTGNGGVGRFTSLAEGAIIPTARGDLRISYKGGDGNDVVLTLINSPRVININTPSRLPDRTVTPVAYEGDLVKVTGTITDPDLKDVFFLNVNWGDGTPTEKHVYPPGSNGKIVELTHRYRDDNPTGTPEDTYEIQLDWHDKAGEGNSATLTTNILNVAPIVAAIAPIQLPPSGVLQQRVLFTDPGRDRWAATVDYGDGSPAQLLEVQSGRQLMLHHQFQQPGSYIVTISVADDDGGVGTSSLQVDWEKAINPSLVDEFFAGHDDQRKLRRDVD